MGKNKQVVGIVCLVICLGLTVFMGVRGNLVGVGICGVGTALIAFDVVRRAKQQA